MYLSLAGLCCFWRNASLIWERRVNQKHSYKGYEFEDATVMLDDGRFHARVCITGFGAGRTRSQRFIDLERFVNERDARQRAISVARAWIDEEQGNDRLALPSSFSPLC